MIRVPKIYRYIIYKLYTWSNKRKTDTPVTNVILTLSFVHSIQLLTLNAIVSRFFPNLDVFNYFDDYTDKEKEKFVGLFFILFSALHYFVLYKKEYWDQYIEEFSHESDSERKKGTIWVISYLIGSIVLYFIILWILFGILR
ncbi:MAG: hypothetical protein KatS3mg027_2488 [Bacteroidia bacterium]|jgi:hypothetical protein|nr:MAG: hypothetical protein KatS3mg027_2488 [Bacteroidia bacterium]